jgi:glutamate synthase domain-containing protein 3
VRIEVPIRNVHRTVGTMLGAELTRRHGGAGLPDDTIVVALTGSAGQSFGAFMAPGITVRVEGDGNDYLGKGLSGGRIVVVPASDAPFVAEDNVIAGNVVLYGATSGECYLRGQVGERFCVRNSGATAVVEGVGDHGCEYMTRGVAVILGNTGRNFAAGMSGGIAYVYDEAGGFETRCNHGLVDLELLESADEFTLKQLIERHHELTGSAVAKRILQRWPDEVRRFVKVFPRDYKRVMAEQHYDSEIAGLATGP